MHITVSQYHVDKAIKALRHKDRHISQVCPIAQAVREKEHRAVSVHVRTMNIRRSGYERRYPLPPEAKSFINNFDKGWPVKVPFTFKVELIDKIPMSTYNYRGVK